MTISDLNSLCRFLCDADTTSYTAANLLINVNNAYEEVIADILNADGRWQWDDTNRTDFPIATTTLGSAASSVTFSSITATYTDLILIGNITGQSSSGGLLIRFNADSASNYSYTALNGNGTSASSSRASNQTEGSISYTDSTTVPSSLITQILNYTNTTTYKTILSRANSNYGALSYVNLWRATPAAINRIDILTSGGYNLNAGSTFTLYGIKAA